MCRSVRRANAIEQRRVRSRRAGLSLIESTALVSLAGVLLAVFVPTFARHVRLSKITEATEQLERMHRGAAAYFARSQVVAGRSAYGCLPSNAGPYPALPSPDPTEVDFSADPSGKATWAALGLTAPMQLRYAYSISTSEPGCAPRATRPTLVFRAEGDLDGDGERSTLERSAVVSADGRELVPQPVLHIVDRVE